MGAYFFFMPRPGFLHLKGSEKVNICGNLLQLPHGFIPSIWFILVYSLSRAGHPRTQDQKILYLETQIPPAGDQRPWGIHVVAQKQLMVGVRSVFISSKLSVTFGSEPLTGTLASVSPAQPMPAL